MIIPSYGREQVLLDSIHHLLAQFEAGDELLLVDQTPVHEAAVEAGLRRLSDAGRILWIRRDKPSITAAMNAGIQAARQTILVFVDDDVIPEAGFIEAHRSAHRAAPEAVIIAGRVLQPWHCDGSSPLTGLAGDTAGPCPEFIGCNFSLRRDIALRIGGFDERFVKVAYRFEAEFGLRARRQGVETIFHPAASLRHLRTPSGGTRSYGNHLRTLLPAHSVGEYYFLFGARPPRWLRAAARRLVSSIRTRHHLRRPWWIPATLLSECLGILWALWLSWRGPVLISADRD